MTCTRNEELANLVAKVQSSGLVRCVRFEERLGAEVLRVDGLLGEFLAVLGPDHVMEHDGEIVWFRSTAGFRTVVMAMVFAQERRIREEGGGECTSGGYESAQCCRS